MDNNDEKEEYEFKSLKQSNSNTLQTPIIDSNDYKKEYQFVSSYIKKVNNEKEEFNSKKYIDNFNTFKNSNTVTLENEDKQGKNNFKKIILKK
jgi:hypothetical protein